MQVVFVRGLGRYKPFDTTFEATNSGTGTTPIVTAGGQASDNTLALAFFMWEGSDNTNLIGTGAGG